MNHQYSFLHVKVKEIKEVLSGDFSFSLKMKQYCRNWMPRQKKCTSYSKHFFDLSDCFIYLVSLCCNSFHWQLHFCHLGTKLLLQCRWRNNTINAFSLTFSGCSRPSSISEFSDIQQVSVLSLGSNICLHHWQFPVFQLQFRARKRVLGPSEQLRQPRRLGEKKPSHIYRCICTLSYLLISSVSFLSNLLHFCIHRQRRESPV